jgi:hypothetical protein
MLKHIVLRIITLLYCFALVACEVGSKSPPGEVVDRSKVEAVTKPIAGKVISLGQLLRIAEGLDTTTTHLRWQDLAFVPPATLWIADPMNWQILVYSVSSQRRIRTIGRRGNGEAEFQSITRVRFLPDYGIVAIDNILRRATLFAEDARVIQTIPLRELTDDILLISHDTAIVSGYSLLEHFKPVRKILTSTGETIQRFGSVREPRVGISKVIRSSPFAKSDVEVYSFGYMTRLVFAGAQSNILYSQSHPYFLVLFAEGGRREEEITRPLPFSTENNNQYLVNGDTRTIKRERSGRVCAPQLLFGKIMVPIFSDSLQENYLDTYDLSGTFLNRLRMPPIAKNLRVVSVTSDSDGVLFVIVQDENEVTWIEQFRIQD